ncbi:MAG TPA: DUF58 domain-containing protein [Desulfuromonadales bacterium]|nr:DUF58 domain-containing protein [Desulfuromonadales bacterium]
MTLLLGFAAVNTGNNLLFLVVSGLLAFMSVTGYVGMLNIKQLLPELIPPPEVYAGTQAGFRLRVSNTKRHIPSFLIRMESGHSLGGVVPFVPRSQAAERPVTFLFPRRGKVTLDPVRISSNFPVNFFTRFWMFDLQQQLIVFPALLPLSADDGPPSDVSGASRCVDQRGQEGELERIASYSGREPFKTIHWKLSARGDDLLVKQFGSQSAPPLHVDLDSMPGSTLEERISQAAWLVKRWSMQRPVSLMLEQTHIPAGMGAQHERHLLTELALYACD